MFRLSAVASTQLTDGNPAITDLSDTNRPTRIAEKFSELYDNEWTDAFEALTSQYHMSEREAVDLLFRILKVHVQSCFETFDICNKFEDQFVGIWPDIFLLKCSGYIYYPIDHIGRKNNLYTSITSIHTKAVSTRTALWEYSIQCVHEYIF